MIGADYDAAYVAMERERSTAKAVQVPERPFVLRGAVMGSMTLANSLHFDEPDKSCFAGYGCTDDCPVANYVQAPPRRPFLWWRRKTLEPLPVARVVLPWRQRVELRLVPVLAYAIWITALLVEFAVVYWFFRLVAVLS